MCDKEGASEMIVRLRYIKKEFSTARDIHTPSDALEGADVFLDFPAGNIWCLQDQIKLMGPNPIVFLPSKSPARSPL